MKVKTDKPGDTRGLNELELVDGKLYGNLFQTQTIVRIDPASGCIEASANMGSLWRSFTDADKKQVSSEENVLNGIAYDKASGTVLRDGKTLADDFCRQVHRKRSSALLLLQQQRRFPLQLRNEPLGDLGEQPWQRDLDADVVVEDTSIVPAADLAEPAHLELQPCRRSSPPLDRDDAAEIVRHASRART